MTELLSHIFGNKPHTPVQARDPNLMQGERFDFMQNAITSRVLPALPLMEQTTGPGLGSIVEPLEVASQSDTKNQYNSVSALNEAEMGNMADLEFDGIGPHRDFAIPVSGSDYSWRKSRHWGCEITRGYF